jgi:hypothetical protein
VIGDMEAENLRVRFSQNQASHEVSEDDLKVRESSELDYEVIDDEQEYELIDDDVEIITESIEGGIKDSEVTFRWWKPSLDVGDVSEVFDKVFNRIIEDQTWVFKDCIEEDHDLFEDAVETDEEESVRRGDPRPTHCASEVHFLESEVFDDLNVAEPEQAEWYDEPFEVALDSGSGEHVADEEEVAPAYTVTSSPGSRAGQHFISAARQRIPNKGQFTVVLKSGDGGGAKGRVIRSTFQSAKVTRPLWSVGRICDEGFDVKFNKTEALILTKQGKVVCRFERRGGLYIARLQLRNPLFERFTGPGTHN